MSALVPPYFGNIQAAGRSRHSTEENVAMAKKEARKLDELFHDTCFFEATDALEEKKLEFLGWHGPSKAVKAIRKYSK